ncbi:T-cell surface glycoprotein CD8 beta chain [Lates calcarifer]|uniref:T-cell surface glycoprotein CD8 beta chain n=1 Tax=Lates calcarifer TaxID=8187 RepID=A0AAJ7QH88_LATCA|nr:T-cell surface glycoprotein CD8 beta chain [Lates calcarifer]
MIPLPLAWTLLTVSLWTTGSSENSENEPFKILYPSISSQETIECDCANISCDSVYWFRSTSSESGDFKSWQYLGKCNNADRVNYGTGVEESRFKLSKRGNSFVLRITKVQKTDTGIYSCILKDKSNNEVLKPASLLQPGVTAPTPPPKPKPKPPVKPVCRCPKKNPPPDGCGSMVLWPLVGLTAGLALAIICTLYYFSRLPKKCRHHFAKKRQML